MITAYNNIIDTENKSNNKIIYYLNKCRKRMSNVILGKYLNQGQVRCFQIKNELFKNNTRFQPNLQNS